MIRNLSNTIDPPDRIESNLIESMKGEIKRAEQVTGEQQLFRNSFQRRAVSPSVEEAAVARNFSSVDASIAGAEWVEEG